MREPMATEAFAPAASRGHVMSSTPDASHLIKLLLSPFASRTLQLLRAHAEERCPRRYNPLRRRTVCGSTPTVDHCADSILNIARSFFAPTGALQIP